jgi:hypothetical protein
VSTPSPSARRRSSPLLVVAMFAVPLVMAAALVTVFRLRPTPPPAQVAQAGSADVQGQLADMQGELQLLRRQLQLMSRPDGAGKGAASGASAEKAAPAAPPPTQEEVSARDKRRFEGLARKLAAEPLDQSWAPATERLIADTIKKPVFKGSKLVEASCRSTLCRFEVLHDSEADRHRFSSALPTRLPSLPSGSMRNAEGPDRKTIVYVAREGHQVPRDEPQEP